MLNFKCSSISANQSSMIIYDNSYYVFYEVMMRVCRRHYKYAHNNIVISSGECMQPYTNGCVCVSACLFFATIGFQFSFIRLKFQFSNVFNFITEIAESKPLDNIKCVNTITEFVVSLNAHKNTIEQFI